MSPNTQVIMGSPAISRRRVLLLAAFGYIVLALLMFGDVLFSSRDLVISNGGTDGFGQFFSWRKFGFDQIRQGNIPLWNPYVFGGAPYFGGFQAALLYPPNLLFLILPVTTAMNYSIVLHLFCAGFFVFLWLFHRKLHPLASFLAGVIWMFSGQYFYHIFAGHLPNLSAMVWAPLFFLTIDAVLDKPSHGWALFGIFVLTMQILAGHPQYVYYTSLIGGLYVLFRLPEAPEKKKSVLIFTVIYLGAIGLSFLQLFTGAQATGETIRSLGLASGVAGSFSFPPEAFLTAFAPEFLGNMKSVPYWGRWNQWEMSLFCSVTGCVFMFFGATSKTDKQRKVIVLILLLCSLIAMGANTKLYELLYYVLPGFNKFRGTSKFQFLSTLFICLLAAMGLDDILSRRRAIRPLIYGVLGFAVVLIVVGFGIRYSAAVPNGSWQNFGKMILLSESSASPALLAKPEFVAQVATNSIQSLLIAAATALTLAVLLICFQRWKRAIVLVAILMTVEMFVFAWRTRDYFDATERLSAIKKQVDEAKGEGRVDFSGGSHNMPMFFGKEDIWGNDPGIPLRYGQLMALLQSVDQQFAAEFDVVTYHPFFKALRYRYVVVEKDGKQKMSERTNAMPHLALIGNYRVIDVRTNTMKAVADRKFDPATQVILEKEPNPRPSGKVSGTVKLTKASTDFLEVEGDLESPAILLITDSYTPSWRAKALRGSSQTEYELLPADYCLRGVPLAAGHHKIRIEYTPSAFAIGKWVSIVSLLAYVVALGWYWKSVKKKAMPTVPADVQMV